MKFKLKGSEFADFITRSACMERALSFRFEYRYPIYPELGEKYFFYLFRTGGYVNLTDLGFFEVTFKDCPILEDSYINDDDFYTAGDYPDKFPKSLSGGGFVLTREGVNLSSVCPSMCSDVEFVTAFELLFFSGKSSLLVNIESTNCQKKGCFFAFKCDDFVVTFDEDFYYGFLNRVLNCDLRRIESILMDVKTILGG